VEFACDSNHSGSFRNKNRSSRQTIEAFSTTEQAVTNEWEQTQNKSVTIGLSYSRVYCSSWHFHGPPCALFKYAVNTTRDCVCGLTDPWTNQLDESRREKPLHLPPPLGREYIAFLAQLATTGWVNHTHNARRVDRRASVCVCHFCLKFREPLAQKLWIGSQNNCSKENGTDVLYPGAKFRRDQFTYDETRPIKGIFFSVTLGVA